MRQMTTHHAILVIGCGSIGERRPRCFEKTARTRVTACETNPASRQLMAETYGVPGRKQDREGLGSGDGYLADRSLLARADRRLRAARIFPGLGFFGPQEVRGETNPKEDRGRLKEKTPGHAANERPSVPRESGLRRWKPRPCLPP